MVSAAAAPAHRIHAQRARINMARSGRHLAFLVILFRYHSTRGMAVQIVVMVPVALDFMHDLLKLGVGAQLVPVLVALEPGVVVITELYGAPKPRNSFIAIPEQRVDGAHPFSEIAVDGFLGLEVEYCTSNLVAMTS